MTAEDVTFSRADIPTTEAYLVRPTDPGPGAGAAVVWFHWLEAGAATSNRTEFLAEARQLAADGVTSLLVQGTFPWTERPSSLTHDVASVEAEVRMLRAALDLLSARSDVDPGRVALVGHDFGGMYAMVLAGTDPRPAALVAMAPTARWGDWFLRYWSILDPADEYLAAMEPIDPVSLLPQAANRPILLQFATKDQYVPQDVASEIAAAAGSGADVRSYDSGHELNPEAMTDRVAWLRERLGLG